MVINPFKQLMTELRKLSKHFALKIMQSIDFLRFPDDKISVLLIVNGKIGFSCLKPIFMDLSQDSRFRVKYTYGSNSLISIDGKTQNIASEKDTCFVSSLSACIMKWDYVVTTDIEKLNILRPHINIMISHGMAFGNSELSQSEYSAKMMFYYKVNISAFNSKAAYESLLVGNSDILNNSRHITVITGSPKSDKLFRESQEDRTQFLRRLGLDPSLKTICITSHYNSKSLLCTLGVELIDLLVQEKDYNIVITGHDRLWVDHQLSPGKGSAPPRLKREIELYEKNNTNVRFFPFCSDLHALLLSADIFIVDNSSVIVECAICDRPILFFDHPDFLFKNKYVGDLFRAASTSFNKSSEAVAIIRNSIETKKQKQKERKELVDFFLANRGMATEKLKGVMLDLGRGCLVESEKWNAFRIATSKQLL